VHYSNLHITVILLTLRGAKDLCCHNRFQ
jgi:hypothetical protein